MQVECQLNHTEMREAFRMNLTPSFWFKTVFTNFRAVFLICVVLAMVAHKIIHKDTHNWQAVVTLSGFAALLIAFMLYIAFFDTGDWLRSARSDRDVPVIFAPQK